MWKLPPPCSMSTSLLFPPGLPPGDGVSGYHQHPGHPLWEVCQDSQGRWAQEQQGHQLHGAGAGALGVRRGLWAGQPGLPLSRARGMAAPASRPALGPKSPRLSGVCGSQPPRAPPHQLPDWFAYICLMSWRDWRKGLGEQDSLRQEAKNLDSNEKNGKQIPQDSQTPGPWFIPLVGFSLPAPGPEVSVGRC